MIVDNECYTAYNDKGRYIAHYNFVIILNFVVVVVGGDM